MPVCSTGDTTYVLRLGASKLPEPLSRPWYERQRIVASVCDRLFGDLDASLGSVREACSSLRRGADPETRQIFPIPSE